MIPPDTLCEQADCYRLAEMQMTLAEHNVYVCSLHPDLVTAAAASSGDIALILVRSIAEEQLQLPAGSLPSHEILCGCRHIEELLQPAGRPVFKGTSHGMCCAIHRGDAPAAGNWARHRTCFSYIWRASAQQSVGRLAAGPDIAQASVRSLD